MYFKGQDELPIVLFARSLLEQIPFSMNMMLFFGLSDSSCSSRDTLRLQNISNWVSVVDLKYGQNDATCGMTYSKPYYIKIDMKEKENTDWDLTKNVSNAQMLNLYQSLVFVQLHVHMVEGTHLLLMKAEISDPNAVHRLCRTESLFGNLLRLIPISLTFRSHY